MKVGLLIDRWNPGRGGAEGALDAFARHLVERGDEVHVFGARCDVDPPGTFHRVRGGGWSRGARERRLGRAMTAAANGVRVDVTVGVRHLERVDLLWLHGGCHRSTMAARRRAARGQFSGPVVLRGRHRTFDVLEHTALEGGARRVVCPSSLVQVELTERYPQAAPRLEVVELGVDLERFHPRARQGAREALRTELGLPSDARVLCFPARNPRLKGFPALLAAFDLLDDPPHLCVAGPRRPPRGVRGRARMHWRRDVDPVTLAAGADLCVLPTWRDTFGLAMVEAMACGTPVVTSPFAGVADRVSGASGEVVTDPTDSRSLAMAIDRVLGLEVETDQVRRAVGDLDLGAGLARLTVVLDGLALS